MLVDEVDQCLSEQMRREGATTRLRRAVHQVFARRAEEGSQTRTHLLFKEEERRPRRRSNASLLALNLLSA